MMTFYGTPWVMIMILLGFVALLAGVVVWSIASYHHQLKHYEEPLEPEYEDKKPICRQNARVLKKEAELVQTGNSKTPSHRMEYTVFFLLEDGKTRCIQVSQAMFEEIFENEQGELVTEGETVLDFNGKFSREL